MREELIAQLNAWHEEDQFEEIVSRIKEVPTPLIDEELAVHLGRALNNLGRYREALKWFNKAADKGKKDPLWHFRVGYAHYYLDEYDEAIKAFKKANKLDPEDQDTIEFLAWSRNEKAALAGDDDDSAEDTGTGSDSDSSAGAEADAAEEPKR
ncbi:tetratricopeptide repeat protein [Paenibacillus tritici]|jgi:tetratricopeptide (TPR) repeat protein|uniref:Tetratricopeptide repeat protein n=1 Tax=Paenibacillus tritici TaxID=1873425 RepID=A0ABX2DRI5_9BACL|nr:tetratricopeptide repeat protein [Paenibacillus tritici]NQX46456.1 tetratricopeptide repeat protein [Paenibacillus tritici]